MDERELEAAAAELIEQERYSDAEDLLRGVHDEAIRNNQADLAICALQELIHIYVIQERLSDHERCQLEIEKLEDSGGASSHRHGSICTASRISKQP